MKKSMDIVTLKRPALRPVRLLLAFCVCALLILTSAFPAVAAQSDLRKGEDKLLNIERKSQEKMAEPPSSMEETQAETNPGLNLVQGEADKEKMYTPEKSGRDESVEARIKRGLEQITP